jgi:phage/plasmid-associated DNA primase
LSGALNKALLALTSLRSRGFSECESTQRAMDELRQATDPLVVWLDRNTILHPDSAVPADRLWGEYNRACQAGGRPTVSKNAFGRAIIQASPTVEKRQRTVNGALSWCYVGIGLLADGAE